MFDFSVMVHVGRIDCWYFVVESTNMNMSKALIWMCRNGIKIMKIEVLKMYLCWGDIESISSSLNLSEDVTFMASDTFLSRYCIYWYEKNYWMDGIVN